MSGGWWRLLSASVVLTATVIVGGVAVTDSPTDPSALGVVTDAGAVPASQSAFSDGARPLMSPRDDLTAAVEVAHERKAHARAEKRLRERERAHRKVRAAARVKARLRTERTERRQERAATQALLEAPLSLTIATANIPNRSPESGYRSTMSAIVAADPDFVTLNEQSGRSLDFIESAAPGYTAWREPTSNGDSNSMNNVVMWKTDLYSPVAMGRTQLVYDDHTLYQGRPVVWDRFAAWVRFERTADGVPVSVISTHMMTNPAKYGPNFGARQSQYGKGMDTLVALTDTLGEYGPVLVGGDMNTHAYQANLGWAAASKMTEAGFAYIADAVDFIFYPTTPRLTLTGRGGGPTPEPDHRWVYAQFG